MVEGELIIVFRAKTVLTKTATGAMRKMHEHITARTELSGAYGITGITVLGVYSPSLIGSSSIP